jgi:hypothetical protein
VSCATARTIVSLNEPLGIKASSLFDPERLGLFREKGLEKWLSRSQNEILNAKESH